jgi:outer membrane protein OmpA-like peptidoglycan-associated protein
MKTRILLALPLAASLMVPALAQTTSDQNQPATTTQSQPQSSSQDQGSAARQPLTYERHEGFWGKINPFARKKYVNRQLDPVRSRVNELDELTASNSKMIRDVDARATEGIRLAHNKATEADQHAIEATNRAQMAHQTAEQANTQLASVSKVVGNLDQYQPVTQTEIRFRPGQLALSKRAKEALDEMASNLKSQKGYVVEVQGFSPGNGQAAIQNSQQMAQSVVRYLVLNHDVPVYRIFTVGMGNAPLPARADGTKPRRTRGGRVEISLLKNNLDQLNAAAPSNTGAMSTQGGTSGTAAEPYAPSTQPAPQQQYQSQPRTQPNAPASNMDNTSPATTTPSTTTEQPAQSPDMQQQAPPRM